MQPRAKEIREAFEALTQARDASDRSTYKRRAFTLVVQGASARTAELREFRATCAMIDLDASIFTLSYQDVLALESLPSAEGGLRITVRPGSFASHAAARLRRLAPRALPARPAEPRRGAPEPAAPVERAAAVQLERELFES